MPDSVVDPNIHREDLYESEKTLQTEATANLDGDKILEEYREKLATARRAFSLPADDEHVMQLRQYADPFKQVNFILQELHPPMEILRDKKSTNSNKLEAVGDLRLHIPLSLKRCDILAEHVVELLGNETRIALESGARITHLKEFLCNFQKRLEGSIVCTGSEIIPQELCMGAHDWSKLCMHWKDSCLSQQFGA